jgi:hypothetical protein
MRNYGCYFYHLENNKLIQNSNTACWAGLNKSEYLGKDIYIDKYIEPEITDKQRRRIVYLLNKITLCKFTTIENVKYIQFKLLNNHYSNLLLLNFIRILWYKNGSFNNKQFFIDICKPKTRNLDYLEFMMTCIKNNVLIDSQNSWGYGDHSFVYKDIIPKTKEMLLKYTGNSMQTFLQCKIEDVK